MAKGKYQIYAEEVIEKLKEPERFIFSGDEKAFEEHVVLHLDYICESLNLPEIEIATIQPQICMNSFICRPDIVLRHKDQTLTVIEVKKVNTKHPSTGAFNQMAAIGQLLLYQNVIEAMTGGRPRLVLIDSKIFYRTYCAFLGNDLPIALLEFQKDRIFIPYKGGW